MSHKELGKVTQALILKEDHNILTFLIDIDFGGCSQGFCNYALDTYSKTKKRRVGTAAGCDLILQLLNLFGVSKFEDIVGKPVYAIRDKEEVGPIIGLEIPQFDGGRKFMIADWQKEWFSEGLKEGKQ